MRTYRLLLVTLLPETVQWEKWKRPPFKKRIRLASMSSQRGVLYNFPLLALIFLSSVPPIRSKRQQLYRLVLLCCSLFPFLLTNSNCIARFGVTTLLSLIYITVLCFHVSFFPSYKQSEILCKVLWYYKKVMYFFFLYIKSTQSPVTPKR